MTSARRERGGTSRSWPSFFSLSVERLRNGAEDTSCTSLIRAGIGKKKVRRNTDRKTSRKKEERRRRWRGDGGAQVFLQRSKPKLSLLKWDLGLIKLRAPWSTHLVGSPVPFCFTFTHTCTISETSRHFRQCTHPPHWHQQSAPGKGRKEEKEEKRGLTFKHIFLAY